MSTAPHGPGATRPGLTARKAVRPTAAAAALALVLGLTAGSALPSQAVEAGAARTAALPTVRAVTLVTGDVVRVTTGAEGRAAVALEPSPDGSIPQAAINEVGEHLYVVPRSAFGLLSTRSIDLGLFDVTTLLDDGYDDASRDTLPVLVDYGRGRPAAAEARTAAFSAADRTVVVPTLGIAAFHVAKTDARAFWADLTKGSNEAGSPTALTGGATRIDLDGQVSVTLEDSVPQIHAPEAWQAGYNGKGVTVAVLDTGYDPTHPDLAGRVVDSANFSPDADVTDGNGHGTHVASTIAGSGAASSGLRKGVAPGADLMVGKVLSDAGFGEDSAVLAGMQWAVNQGADVISMSLGGDVDDGTNPLARAVNELSASSDSLFVVAAGNNGYNGPSSVTAPGTADAALTVGAVDVNDVMAGFSGRGPRAGVFGLKPEVVAPGVDVTAARAAGTELGPIVDDAYTTISGTSMATPHVAGLAAILKQEHPAWDGEQLKSAIANSTVPVADATGFDAGTGRIDALLATGLDVFAPASMDLGSYRWPYATAEPRTQPLTYTNTGATAVELSLSLAGEDGSPEGTGSMTLGAETLTVPAGGEASVDVTVDPTVAGAGSYSAVVTATPNDGGGTVRTLVGYQLEPERYDVTVVVRPRAGTVSASHQIGLSGFDDYSFDSRTLDAAAGERSVTFRVAPGRYSTGVVSFGLAADGAQEGVVSYEPSFSVSEDTTIVLDEGDTAPFGYSVDQPVVGDGGILDVAWDGPAGHTGFMLYGFTDRMYALPTDGGPDANASVAENWLLAQPEGLFTADSGEELALRPVPTGSEKLSEVSVRPLDARIRLVDAGRVGRLRTAHVKGAAAVVAGRCADLSATVTALEDAGAAAVVAYPGRGAQCAGTLSTRAGVPVLQARPFEVSGLLDSAPLNGRLVTHRNPAYMYDLVHFWPNEVPAGGTISGTGRSVTALVESYDGLGSRSSDGLRLIEELYGWVPARGGVANIGLLQRVGFPSTVTHYVSTGAKWERTVEIQDADLYGEYARLWSPPEAFTGGTTVQDEWFGGPISTGVSDRQQVTNGSPPPTREGDEMFFSMGAFKDAAGHFGNSEVFSNEYHGRLYVDGFKILDQDASVFMSTVVPAGAHDYRLETKAWRNSAFWKHSTQITSTWQFSSHSSKQPIVVLPLLGVDYDLPLNRTGDARAGAYHFQVSFSVPQGAQSSAVVGHRVSISWNGGASWSRAATDCTESACDVHVVNRPGLTATLRVSATDAAGRSVHQTVVDAYGVLHRSR